MDNYNGFYLIISKILFSFLNGECEIESKTTYTPILPLNGGDWNIHKSYHIGYTCNFCLAQKIERTFCGEITVGLYFTYLAGFLSYTLGE